MKLFFSHRQIIQNMDNQHSIFKLKTKRKKNKQKQKQWDHGVRV